MISVIRCFYLFGIKVQKEEELSEKRERNGGIEDSDRVGEWWTGCEW